MLNKITVTLDHDQICELFSDCLLAFEEYSIPDPDKMTALEIAQYFCDEFLGNKITGEELLKAYIGRLSQ